MPISEGRQEKGWEALGGNRPGSGRKNKVEKSHRPGKARVAVGCGKGAGLSGASLGMFPRGAARPWKLFPMGEKGSISRG